MRVSLLVLCLLVACSFSASGPPERSAGEASASAWPDDWSAVEGERVTVQGTAVDAKLGAQVLGPGERRVWVDLEHWPEGLYEGDSTGEQVRVTGTVTARDDVPVVLVRPGEPVSAGVPVSSEEEAEQARRRYVLTDVEWSVVE